MFRRHLLLGAGALALSGCGKPATDYRFRLKIVAEKDGRPHEGASVVRVRWWDQRGIPGASGYLAWTRAESPIVDLGELGMMFATLRQRDGHSILGRKLVMALVGDPGLAFDERLRRLGSVRGEIALRGDWPIFVRFGELNDPRSVVQGAPFGAKVSRVSVQLVDEPVTDRICNVLPWLPSLRTALSGGQMRVRASLADRLGPRDFWSPGAPLS